MIARRPTIAAILLAASVVACDQQKESPATELHEQSAVLIKGATFRMGTDESELENIAAAIGLDSAMPLLSEVAAHETTVADFYVDSFTVTNQDFLQFVSAVPVWSKESINAKQPDVRYLEHWQGNQPESGKLDHPVTFITWHAAAAYCDWRGQRLLTEAEFEWAAQSGAGDDMFPWGTELPSNELVNWGGNGIDTTVSVGSYPPNARGLYDMSGNVWQFTADPWLGTYEQVTNNPGGPAEAANDPDIRRVVRGGSYGANAANLRVRYRDSHRPYDAREMVGFRCGRTAD